MRIRVSTIFDDWPYQRQSPGNSGRWDDAEFFFNEPANGEYDFWIVFNGLKQTESAICPPEHTIFVTWEPPSISQAFNCYDNRVLNQFAAVVTCERNDIEHRSIIHSQQCIPWEVGRRIENGQTAGFRMGYDDWSAMPPPAKPKFLSIICSNKTLTEGHRKRRAFAERLKEHFKDKIDLFGKGIREIPDKWDAIVDYKYHVAIENSMVRHYWTEKLADPYIGWSLPVYYGCANLTEYFSDKTAYLSIDIEDIAGSIQRIEEAVATDRYEHSLPAIRAARDLVLNRYNLFPAMMEICRRIRTNAPPRKLTLKSRMDSMVGRVVRRIRSSLSS